MSDTLRQRKRADLLSISGAAIAALALGAWLAPVVAPVWPLLFALGMAAHAVGMAARHRLDRREGPLPRAWQWLYLLCWAAIAAAAAMLAGDWLGGAR